MRAVTQVLCKPATPGTPSIKVNVLYTVSEKDCTLFFIYISGAQRKIFEKGTIFFGHL